MALGSFASRRVEARTQSETVKIVDIVGTAQRVLGGSRASVQIEPRTDALVDSPDDAG
jgi:hypothetical protein